MALRDIRWPCDPPYRVTQGFGENPNSTLYGYGPQGHPGVDFVIERAPYAVLAPHRGWVTRDTASPTYGLSVFVQAVGEPHIHSRLSHLSGFVALPGSLVEPGDLLGYMGSTGHAYGAHVDWELWIEGRRVDPVAYLRAQEERMAEEREQIVPARWHVEEATRQIEAAAAAMQVAHEDAMAALEAVRERLVSEVTPRLYRAAGEEPGP